jgi:hypothetical protein
VVSSSNPNLYLEVVPGRCSEDKAEGLGRVGTRGAEEVAVEYRGGLGVETGAELVEALAAGPMLISMV